MSKEINIPWEQVLAGARELDAKEFGEAKAPEDKLADDIEYERHKRLVRRTVDEEEREANAAPIPKGIGLTEFLATPIPGEKYRVQYLWPADGRVILAAPSKAGKSTVVGNVVRALCDGGKFLDMWDVTERAAKVAILDFELSPRLAQEWLAAQRIKDTDRAKLYSLRGAESSFAIESPTVRKKWAGILAGTDVLILDCIGPAMAAQGINENDPSEVRRFLTALDELLRAAGIPDALVVHHMGHNGERSRGASTLRDWPDAEWKLARDEKTDIRYFSAYGRDVDIWETALTFNSATRHLEGTGEGRKATGAATAETLVLEALKDREVTGRKLVELLAGKVGKQQVTDIANRLTDEGKVIKRDGSNRSHLYRLPE